MRTPLSRVNRRGRITVVVLAAIFLLFTLFDRVIEGDLLEGALAFASEIAAASLSIDGKGRAPKSA